MRHLMLIAALVAAPLAFATDGPHLNEAEVEAAIQDAATAAAERAADRVLDNLPAAQNTTVVQPVESRVEYRDRIVPLKLVEKLAIGIGGDSAGGCKLPSVDVGFKGETDGLEAAGDVRLGGNLACKLSSFADLSLERDYGNFSLEIGYDLRSVSVQEVRDGRRVVWYGSVDAVSALAQADFDVELPKLGTVNLEAGLNFMHAAPRIAATWERGHFTASFETTEYGGFLADELTIGGSGLLSTARLAYARDFQDSDWGFEVYGSRTHGLDKVPDPVVWRNDAGLTGGPAAPETETWAYGLRLTRPLR